MRLLFLMMLLSIGSFSIAQNPNIRTYKIGEPGIKPINKNQVDSFFNELKKNYHFNRDDRMVSKLNSRVKYLADGMPCIVPEKATAAIIPNAWRQPSVPFRIQGGAIPNPALPAPFSFKEGD